MSRKRCRNLQESTLQTPPTMTVLHQSSTHVRDDRDSDPQASEEVSTVLKKLTF